MSAPVAAVILFMVFIVLDLCNVSCPTEDPIVAGERPNFLWKGQNR